MPYYVIKFDFGYGPQAEVVEADNQKEATEIAYETWRENAENNAEYSAELATYENVSSETFEDPAQFGLTEET